MVERRWIFYHFCLLKTGLPHSAETLDFSLSFFLQTFWVDPCAKSAIILIFFYKTLLTQSKFASQEVRTPVSHFVKFASGISFGRRTYQILKIWDVWYQKTFPLSFPNWWYFRFLSKNMDQGILFINKKRKVFFRYQLCFHKTLSANQGPLLTQECFQDTRKAIL